MFCIAAFIIILFMAAVSARYRKYVKKAWNCTWRRVTFRPCDTTFKQDIKDHLLAPLAARHPRLVKPASTTLEILAFLVVLTTVWSGYTVVESGLNLYVYGTCNKQDSASCSLGAEACSIPDQRPSFGDSLAALDIVGAFGNDFARLGETIGELPTRFRDWKTSDYLPENATFLTEDAATPDALEIVDPGCLYCKNLFANIEESGFTKTHNLSYIAYPIASTTGYKFPNSLLVTQYLEALRLHPLAGAQTPVDWQVLSRIYTGHDAAGAEFQGVINTATHAETVALLDSWLTEFGLTDEQLSAVKTSAASGQVAAVIARNKTIVGDRVKTLKIPTIIFDGRRHDGLVSVGTLR